MELFNRGRRHVGAWVHDALRRDIWLAEVRQGNEFESGLDGVHGRIILRFVGLRASQYPDHVRRRLYLLRSRGKGVRPVRPGDGEDSGLRPGRPCARRAVLRQAIFEECASQGAVTSGAETKDCVGKVAQPPSSAFSCRLCNHNSRRFQCAFRSIVQSEYSAGADESLFQHNPRTPHRRQARRSQRGRMCRSQCECLLGVESVRPTVSPTRCR